MRGIGEKMRIDHIRIALPVLVSFQLLSASHGQAISVAEAKIVDYVDAGSADSVALLERSVNSENPTENLEGVREVGAVFMNEFRSIGLKSKWISMPPGMKSAGHHFAETGGTSVTRILLLGHLDTVLAGE